MNCIIPKMPVKCDEKMNQYFSHRLFIDVLSKIDMAKMKSPMFTDENIKIINFLIVSRSKHDHDEKNALLIRSIKAFSHR